MPKKKEDLEIKKTKEELSQELMAMIKEPVKEKIVSEVVDDIKSAFDNEYKGEIKRELKSEIVTDIRKDIAKEQKRLVFGKNFKIFRLSIYLIVIVGALLYLIYRLYTTDNMGVIDSRLTRPTASSDVSSQVTTKPVSTEPVRDLAYYMEKYSYIMDDMKIYNYSLVNGSYVVANMSSADKLSMAYAQLQSSDIVVDGIIHMISDEAMKQAYNKMFGSLDGYEATSFSIRNLSYAYSFNSASYIAIGDEDLSTSEVRNHIVDIKEENNKIKFTTRVYVVKNSGIYNVGNMNTKIADDSETMDFSKIESRLSLVEYTFALVNDEYRLESIQKK